MSRSPAPRVAPPSRTARLALLSLGLGALMLLLLILQKLGLSGFDLPAFRADGIKQFTGYTLLILMIANTSYGLWRAPSTDVQRFPRLLLIHQLLGLLAALGVCLHASAVPTGYLQLLWLVMALLALSGGLRHQEWWTLSPVAHRWLLGTHIALGCAILVLALQHLYFVYVYAR